MMESPFEAIASKDLGVGPGQGDLPETWYANRRKSGFVYLSRSFPARFGRDVGYPSRFVHRVFTEGDPGDRLDVVNEGDVDYEDIGIVRQLKTKQIRLQLVRFEGVIREILLEEVPKDDSKPLKRLLTLDRSEAAAFVSMLKGIEGLSPDGDVQGVRIDDGLLQEVLDDSNVLGQLYDAGSSRLRELITSDVDADDVIALERRKAAVRQMETWLEDEREFERAANSAGGRERAWQCFFEDNPWILGVGLGGQLLTSFVEGKLEQTVSGATLVTQGNRVDALFRSAGLINSLVFAEIKHHKTGCLRDRAYRSGVWAPSLELSGAVAQVQETVRAAIETLPSLLTGRAKDGERLDDVSYLYHPRCFVVCGSLGEFMNERDVIEVERFRSFESYRRHIRSPEVLTFDEVLERAKWAVQLALEENL